MANAAPGKLREVDQAVGTPEVDKGAKVTQAAYGALAGLAFLEFIDEAVFLILSPLAHRSPLRQDQAISAAV